MISSLTKNAARARVPVKPKNIKLRSQNHQKHKNHKISAIARHPLSGYSLGAPIKQSRSKWPPIKRLSHISSSTNINFLASMESTKQASAK